MSNTTQTINFKLNKEILDVTGDANFTYTATINDDKVKVSWKENGQTQYASYTLDEMNKYFECGDWVRL